MELPTIPQMRNDYSAIVKNLECLIACFATKDDLSQKEYLSQFINVTTRLDKLVTKMNGFDHPNTKIKKQYSKAYKEIWKIRENLRDGTSKTEKKYIENNLNFSWEHIYKTTQMRNDILAHLKVVLKDLTKLQKKI